MKIYEAFGTKLRMIVTKHFKLQKQKLTSIQQGFSVEVNCFY